MRYATAVASIVAAVFAAGESARPAAAQDQAFTRDIAARARIFPEIGAGVSALKRDASGRHYVLAAPANAIAIYGADGSQAGQIPNVNSRGTQIVFASDIDVDAEGRLFVADRGANMVRVFDAAGAPIAAFRVASPLSVAALSGGEFAATTLHSGQLVNIFDARGTLARTFGEIPEASRGLDESAMLSPGRLYGDGNGHIYFAFTDLLDPTIRKYDRFGYASLEISLPASEFTPPRGSRQWATVTIGKNGVPPEKPVITALAIDPETEEVWVAIGDELVHFDKDGTRRAAYHTTTKSGARIEAASILVEHERILVAEDPNGIFDFAYPEPRQASLVNH